MAIRLVSILSFVLLVLSLTVLPNTSFALDQNELMGEYSLTAFRVQYPGDPMVTSDHAAYFSGRLSMTTKGFVADMSGSAVGKYIAQYFCGFYTTSTSSDKLYVSIKGGSSSNLDASYSNDTFVTSGYIYDAYGYSYWLECTWEKNQNYYTSSGYTQEQLNQAVSTAVEAKDAIITVKENQIASMFTQTQLNQAVTSAESAKATIIAQKDATISALSDIDGDQKTDMKDIVWGLQVLSGNK